MNTDIFKYNNRWFGKHVKWEEFKTAYPEISEKEFENLTGQILNKVILKKKKDVQKDTKSRKHKTISK